MEKIPIAHIFADNLVTLRKRKGLSQADLAHVTGISGRMISHYELEGVIPPADRLQALADALAVPVMKLFDPTLRAPEPATDLTGIDARSVKKLRDILSLPVEDRTDLYRILNKMLRKHQLETQLVKR
ncbi:MAG: helix-turn-helix transcriptional regulator [Prevotella sp.]|nr:helix-turn-helix transcriptional regulator [Prevotella sp.]